MFHFNKITLKGYYSCGSKISDAIGFLWLNKGSELSQTINESLVLVDYDEINRGVIELPVNKYKNLCNSNVTAVGIFERIHIYSENSGLGSLNVTDMMPD